MKNTVLIDSGPLIALFDKSDRYHQEVLSFLKSFDGKLVTTWAVLTEVSYMLDFNLQVQIDFLKWIELGAVEVYEITQSDLVTIIEMMERYTNVPMDLADASLMFVAHKEDIRKIVSIDSDFDIYRTLKSGFLENLLRTK
jgi:hypothetical protein